MRRLFTLWLTAVLTACTLNTPPAVRNAPSLTDSADVMSGICFEAALALSGQVFILNDQAQLDAVYDQIDETGLCRRPIIRHSLDFNANRKLAGVWTYAPSGCQAQHDLVQLWRDDARRTISLRYAFVVTGDCPYELIRPLWVAVENADDYAVVLDVQRAP